MEKCFNGFAFNLKNEYKIFVHFQMNNEINYSMRNIVNR